MSTVTVAKVSRLTVRVRLTADFHSTFHVGLIFGGFT